MWQSEISYYCQAHVMRSHQFLDSVLANRDPRYTGEDGVHAVRCTLATILSAMESRRIRVEEVPEDFSAYWATVSISPRAS